ncbi:hypothetical protein CNAG_06802 [Cryptococcus neoformans var. grubii H99]|uniref:Uncharacterized protein n=1 Tax=Cryptococcus neoformans (strain H99 / ATCC 208821 / CBS 10515 / FGSC 9487) TaxID=235443 RepID=J9VF85_CRYN9|nr:hypothetical protein CNAG_06802 [Cryptococcus neoformans var. grubii H99]AFR92997.1 hypothetical protein CNAG_06802 [Cryptococcus neoformans var. grubii H99]|eukprot:XP_012047740.1 hypothetical protein CNAG_06802 [Cryptococcus neoformans var. grubii H99]
MIAKPITTKPHVFVPKALPRKPATVSTREFPPPKYSAKVSSNTCYQDIIPFYNFREAACGTLADDIDHEGFIPSNGNSTYDKANGTSSAALSGGASASAAATTSAPATADAVSSSAAAFATVNMVTARGLALGGMSVTGILIGGLLLI